MPKNLPVPGRWLEKVDMRGPDDCWEWTASRDRHGYGRFQEPTPNGQRHIRAHVWAYEHFHGPRDASMHVMHTCDNPPCVNPAHLELGTPKDNNDDKIAKGRHAVIWGEPLNRLRQTHCHRGHEFTEENTYRTPYGHRQCRTCNRINARIAYRRQHGLPVREEEVTEWARSA